MPLSGTFQVFMALLLCARRFNSPQLAAAVSRTLRPGLCATLQSSSSPYSKMSVPDKFNQEGVVPDVLPVAPANPAKVFHIQEKGMMLKKYLFVMQVAYPAGEVDFGNVMTPTQVDIDKMTLLTKELCLACPCWSHPLSTCHSVSNSCKFFYFLQGYTSPKGLRAQFEFLLSQLRRTGTLALAFCSFLTYAHITGNDFLNLLPQYRLLLNCDVTFRYKTHPPPLVIQWTQERSTHF